MKRTNRVVQHKESQSSEVKKAQEIRRENQKLKREVARLKRELDKRENLVIESEQNSEPADIQIEVNGPTKDLCPGCNSANLRKVQLGVRMLVVCEDCKYRKMAS